MNLIPSGIIPELKIDNFDLNPVFSPEIYWDSGYLVTTSVYQIAIVLGVFVLEFFSLTGVYFIVTIMMWLFCSKKPLFKSIKKALFNFIVYAFTFRYFIE